MKSTLHAIAATAALAGLLGASTVQAAGFTNGSFETGDLTGWTSSVDSYGLNPFGTAYGSGMDGKYWAWLAGYENPRFIEQTVTGLTASSSYLVSFIMASEFTLSDKVVVTADGVGAATFAAPPYPGGSAFWTTWVPQTYTFTASGTSATIRFSTFGLDPSAQFDVGIDNVMLSTAAVPEPETYALMLAGLGVLAWVARRRSS